MRFLFACFVPRSASAIGVRIAFCLIAVKLAACGGSGGGSGSGGSSGGSDSGGGGSEPPPTDPPAQFAIDDGNIVDLANIALLRSEYLQLNAELMVSASLITQLVDDETLNVTCFDGQGSIMLGHLDADVDGFLSPGDQVRLEYADCEGVVGNISLEIESIAQTGATLDRLTGSVTVSLVVSGDDSDLTIESSQIVSYAVDSNSVSWASYEGGVTTEAFGIKHAITDASVTVWIDVDTNSYEVQMSGAAVSASNEYDFETIEPFTGTLGRYPKQGFVDLVASSSAGRILHTDDPADRPTLAQYQIDEDGSGQFGPTTYTPWDNILSGAIFGVENADDYLPIPGVSDLTSRRKYLEGISSDVVMDYPRNQLYVSITDRNEIAVVDVESLLVTDRIPIGAGPEGLWPGSDGNTLYVALGLGGAVAALDIDAKTSEYVPVAESLGNAFAYDVVEASPGILFVAGNPGPGGIGYLARVDWESADVTRVGADVPIFDNPALAAGPDGRFLYAGDQSRLLKIDTADFLAPVILEREIAADRNISLSADGKRVYLRSGEILDTETFEDLGVLEAGVPYALANGLEVLIARDDFKLSIYDAQTRLHIDLLSTGCGLTEDLNTLIPYGEFGRWMMLADLGFCAVDFYNPSEPPGSDSADPPIEEPEPVSVTSETISLGSFLEDMAYDASRNRIYVSDSMENQIYSIDADTFEVIETFALDGKALGIDLNPVNSHLAIAVRDAAPLSILDLAAGTLANIDISTALGRPVGFDVSFVDDDAIFVSGDTGDAYLVRAYADGSSAIRVADESQISNNATQWASPDGQRLYVAEWNPYRVYALDISQELAPIVASYQAEDDPSSLGTSLSPDGASFAISQGIVLRTSDLSQRGTVDNGTPLFTADGLSLAVAGGSGNVDLYDSVNFTKTMIVDPGCDVGGSPKLFQFGDNNDWAMVTGNQVCRFSMPPTGTQGTKPIAGADSKVTAPYRCDSDCISRRLVLPRFQSLVSGYFGGLLQDARK